jgi:hypothetical protein
MSRTFADLLPTSLAAESLAELALSRADDLLLLLTAGSSVAGCVHWTKPSWPFFMNWRRTMIHWCCWPRH